MLNSPRGGFIHIGIDPNGKVEGVVIDRNKRDAFRSGNFKVIKYFFFSRLNIMYWNCRHWRFDTNTTRTHTFSTICIHRVYSSGRGERPADEPGPLRGQDRDGAQPGHSVQPEESDLLRPSTRRQRPAQFATSPSLDRRLARKTA